MTQFTALACLLVCLFVCFVGSRCVVQSLPEESPWGKNGAMHRPCLSLYLLPLFPLCGAKSSGRRPHKHVARTTLNMRTTKITSTQSNRHSKGTRHIRSNGHNGSNNHDNIRGVKCVNFTPTAVCTRIVRERAGGGELLLSLLSLLLLSLLSWVL